MGKEMCNKITAPSNKSIKIPPNNLYSIFINPTNEIEIKKSIENLKIKNGGVDKINSKILKTMSDLISDPLTHIINNCIEKSI